MADVGSCLGEPTSIEPANIGFMVTLTSHAMNQPCLSLKGMIEVRQEDGWHKCRGLLLPVTSRMLRHKNRR